MWTLDEIKKIRDYTSEDVIRKNLLTLQKRDVVDLYLELRFEKQAIKNPTLLDLKKQNKLLVREVAKLKEENKQLKLFLNADDKIKTNSLNGFEKLKEENTKLQEQLKNAIVLPNFTRGQKIFYISDKHIKEGYFQQFNNEITAEVLINPVIVNDKIEDCDFEMPSHNFLFATEAEAQKYLEGRNGSVGN